jgi:hypothetical protein
MLTSYVCMHVNTIKLFFTVEKFFCKEFETFITGKLSDNVNETFLNHSIYAWPQGLLALSSPHMSVWVVRSYPAVDSN